MRRHLGEPTAGIDPQARREFWDEIRLLRAIITGIPPPLPRGAIVAGNPARLIRYRFSEKIIERMVASRWWMLPDEILATLPFDDVPKFLDSVEMSGAPKMGPGR